MIYGLGIKHVHRPFIDPLPVGRELWEPSVLLDILSIDVARLICPILLLYLFIVCGAFGWWHLGVEAAVIVTLRVASTWEI